MSALRDELCMPDGRVLDLMSSWVSHLSRKPADGPLVLVEPFPVTVVPRRLVGR
ncbi:hypothetical protein [Nocardioides sp.]|uniref:hypothetical protein n=1 Tax=Nocardioides sp. TaxID=35761 RepID=UPI0026113167|nr:hypothetical protein [Nocardioides sp.]